MVGQGRGSLRVRAKNSPIQVLLLAAVECAIVHSIIQVFPEEINKHGSSSIWLFYVVGIDLEGWASVDQVEVPFLAVPKQAKQSPKSVVQTICQVLGLGDLLAK